jgi:hypothetical protein
MCVFILILNSVLINCSWKRNISLFWYYKKQIMNVSSCNGKNIFIRWKMECSIQLGCRLVEWNIPSFTSWKYSYHYIHKHSLFVYHAMPSKLCYTVSQCHIITNSPNDATPENHATTPSLRNTKEVNAIMRIG